MSLTARPIALRDANAFVEKHHRHSKPKRGCKFTVSVLDGDRLCGVAICSRPDARMLQDGVTLDIARNATDGTRNACSFLYGRCIAAARILGFKRVITYTLATETGASVRASGFRRVAVTDAAEWDRPSRRRESTRAAVERVRWEIIL